MADTVYCSQCGTPTAAGALFCQRCGSKILAAAPSTLSAPASTAVAMAPVAAIPVMPESYYGGFWIRLAAHLIDHAVLGAVFVPGFFIFVLPAIITAYHDGTFEQNAPPIELIRSVALFVFLAIGARMFYEILLTSSSWQGTIGKKLLRLKVTDDFGNRISVGRSTGRFFAKILSGMASYIGFIMIAFMDRKRGLHDVIAHTQVLRY
jgi:uncharacterized RDD family membrane protein YckC